MLRLQPASGCEYAAAMRHRFLILFALLILMLPAPALPLSKPPALASLAGELLEFRVRWNFITAGTASLEVVAEKGGRLRLRALARTLPILDMIYPVEELVESSVTLPGPQVVRYYKKAREGWRNPRVDEVLFDHATGRAKSFKNGAAVREVDVPSDVQDPLSCFYWYRAFALKDDAPVTLELSDGGKVVTGTVIVLGRETVETPAGTFKTVIVEPKIEGVGGVFRKSPGARVLIWLTDDEWRRPVKLQSKVIVGRFTAELVSYRPPSL